MLKKVNSGVGVRGFLCNSRSCFVNVTPSLGGIKSLGPQCYLRIQELRGRNVGRITLKYTQWPTVKNFISWTLWKEGCSPGVFMVTGPLRWKGGGPLTVLCPLSPLQERAKRNHCNGWDDWLWPRRVNQVTVTGGEHMGNSCRAQGPSWVSAFCCHQW